MATNEGDANQPADEDEQPEPEQEEFPPEPEQEPEPAAAEEEEEEEEEGAESSDSDGGGGGYYYGSSDDEDDRSPEATLRKFTKALESRNLKKMEEREERNLRYHEDRFDFPKDPENWREEDLRELWADAPVEATEPGWDPVWASDEEWEIVKEELKAGRDPPIAPFYLPYRRYYPVIPDNHHDISSPKSVIEELDRIEEFLRWGSYIFVDGSSYEGTIWDDLAHGKGVYVAEDGLVRYEGEWLRNEMEGHGVVEVEIPGVEPLPGSKLEAKMRKEGRIISRDFMSPEDKQWLEMDMEDSFRLAGSVREVPFYERKEWIDVFGQKPEKGRYRYAGQWKHGRMHGCGVYEVNERIIYGRFYFGEHLDDSTGCDSDVSALHAGIAEVAAAKARMFVNKPDGMVREERGPYGDPQHPYFYEEEDSWMAPGFVNQFYEVPDYWKTYVEEVDQEREMWLNSFYKAPLRIPMPAELEHWWSKDNSPEFVLINQEPEPDPEDPSKLIYTEDPLILHVPTGKLINYVEDEEHGVRLFWQPDDVEEGEEPDPEKAVFLPLGFDEFYGRAAPDEKQVTGVMRIISSAENRLKQLFQRLDNWVEEKKKASEMNQKLIEKELEFIEAEICLEEALEDMEDVLKKQQKEEEKRSVIEDSKQVAVEADEDEPDSDDEEDGGAPTSFGTVIQEDADESKDKPGKSPFSSLTMSLASFGPVSVIPSQLQLSFLPWKKQRTLIPHLSLPLKVEKLPGHYEENICSVKVPRSHRRRPNMRAVVQRKHSHLKRSSGYNQLNSLARVLSSRGSCNNKKVILGREIPEPCDIFDFSIASLHIPITENFALS